MNKSIVGAFVGGRGSGKTLSMSVEAAIQLILGRRVFSNYPIEVKYRDEGGKVTEYRSTPYKMDDLLTFDQELQNAFILLDEANLFLDARRSQSTQNLLISRLITFIRKRQLSILVTTQGWGMLEKRLREQTDLLVECFDLSFRYPNLKAGAFISQEVTDISGIFTGRPLFRGDEYKPKWWQNTRTRILHGMKFWNIYDTNLEFDIVESMTRYRLEVGEKLISMNAGEKAEAEERFWSCMQALREDNPNGYQATADEMRELLSSWGVTWGSKTIGGKLREAGARYKQTRNGNYYILE